MNSLYTITIEGLNLHHVMTFFNKNNIVLKNVKKTSTKTITLTINKRDFKLLKNSELYNNYTIKIIHECSHISKLKFFAKKIGLILGIIIMLFFTQTTTSKIQNIYIPHENHTCSNAENCIFTKENINKLSQILKDIGIYSKMSCYSIPNSRTTEQYLMKQFPQISGVNLQKNGTNLYINIIEANLNIQDAKNIISPYNAIIISLDITSGSTNYKNGDIIKKGEILVSSTNNNPAVATAKLRVFFNDSNVYNENQETYIRTGKTQTNNSLSIFGLSLKSLKPPNYKYYEKSSKKYYSSLNMLLPIKINKTTYFELEKIDTFIPYKNQETLIKENLFENLKNTIPNNAEIKNATYTTVREENRVRTDCYIETILTIKKEG